jgi:DNA (cytosine-5)-methyltransferase 1
MKHLGDICKISGYSAPIVDCIIGGSPCQDLSVAGKRAGLDGERSGLYMEQIRIVKEMRERDERNGRTDVDIRPRYMVWENVPGSFSSAKGEDFRIVLEELAKIADKDAVIPMPEKGKWTTCGCILGDGWSIAWRVLDAQFWGVPQRRRRIALVADFGGQSAPEILFVRKSVSGHTEPSKSKRKEPSSDASRGIGTNDTQCVTFEPGIASREGGHIYEGVSGTLRANAGDNQMATAYTLQDREGKAGGGKGALIAKELSATLRAGFAQTLFQPIFSVENHPNDSRVGINEDGKVQALTSRMGTGGGNVPMVLMEAFQHHGYRESDVCGTLTSGQNNGVRGDTPLVCYSSNLYGDDKVGTLMARDFKGVGRVDTFDRVVCQAVDCRNCTEDDVNGALQSNSAHSLNGNNVVRTRYIVRRLTPLECERLQGYPDGWTDIGEWTDSNGKKRQTSDAARYKALGNSIALPPWKWVLKRLCACYERDATMASLFDGIGGFPYLWEQLNGNGTCLWASEIEEFPMAVTKVRISISDKKC